MTIDKLSWIEIQDRKVLFVRTRGQELFYTVGGKREEGENDIEALAREMLEEISAVLIPETAQFLNTFIGPAHNKPEGTVVELKCYTGKIEGEMLAASEIEELRFLSSEDMNLTTEPGRMILSWLKEKNMID